MASFLAREADSCGAPSWRLQSRRRVAPPASVHNSLAPSGFRGWTDVPPVGVPDPQIADQTRFGKRPDWNVKPSKECDPHGLGAGKIMVPPFEHNQKPEGRYHFLHLTNIRTTEEQVTRGVKCVPSRSKKNTAAGANPNQVADINRMRPPGTEGVKMFPGSNTKDYNCWEPQDLWKAKGGDWNWNTACGFRKVARLPNGEPKRSLAHPVAWPAYPGYPPDREAATGTRIDYALARNGGHFGTAMKEHPDLVASRDNRVAASDPARVNQAMRFRGLDMERERVEQLPGARSKGRYFA